MSQSARKIEAVVFDVGRVLVQWDLRTLFRKLIDDPDELEWFVQNIVSEEWHFQHDAGRDLAQMVTERKAQFPQYGAYIDAYATRFNETVPGPVEGTHALVSQLADRDVPLFCITNFADSFWDHFYPEWPVLNHFQDIVVSGKEKLVKPDPAIFQLAERRFGHAAQCMLFIDDNQANIASARKLGWQVHLFRQAAELEADLRQHDLLG